MSKRTIEQFAAYRDSLGKYPPLREAPTITPPCWPHLQPVRRQTPTLRPSAPDVTPHSLRAMAAEMRADASRWLARANDLDAAAKRLEGE